MTNDWLTVIQKLHARVTELPTNLQNHIVRVLWIAQDLAFRHEVNVQEATVCVLAHDLYRHLPIPELEKIAQEKNLTLSGKDYEWHGQIAAHTLIEEYHVKKGEITQAVFHHTLFQTAFFKLGAILFVADKLDPKKGMDKKLTLLAKEDLKRVIAEIQTIQRSKFGY